MGTAFDARLEPLLVLGFAATAIFWLLLSSWVLVDRALYDRRKRRLVEIGRQLSDPRVAALPDARRASTIGAMLATLPRHEVYRLASNNEISPWVREACAAYSIGRIGAARMLRDAGGTRKWRRISALHALAYDPPAELHDLLQRALADADPDVASAAATVLQRLGDRRAAEILIGGLREARLPASRIVRCSPTRAPRRATGRRRCSGTHRIATGSPRRSCPSPTTPTRPCARRRCSRSPR